jgi:cytochrome b subunit of formate dehydrogenase
MESGSRIKRFTTIDRLTHLLLILTFMILTVTGTGQLFMETDWGRRLLNVFGGYHNATTIHIWAGWVMTVGFLLHIVYALSRVDWRRPIRSLFGSDSLLPSFRDFKEFGQRLLWFVGIGREPRFERWTYWEKFDYWAVFWGVPILFISGLMLIYPVETSRILPGWTLNVAALVHRAEAVLAVIYIVLIHLLVGHFRRKTFPLNDVMFSGSVPVEKLAQEKPDWLDRLERENRLTRLAARPPALWYRALYFVFGYAVIALGLYIVVAGVYYSRFIQLH